MNTKQYKRPKKTIQDKLTPTEIKEKLEDYLEVSNLKNVPIGSHLRYFTKKDGKKVFRLGGYLVNNSNSDKYIVLSTDTSPLNYNRVTWSVQVKDSIFFRKLSLEEIKEEYEEKIRDLKKIIKKLKKKLIEKS